MEINLDCLHHDCKANRSSDDKIFQDILSKAQSDRSLNRASSENVPHEPETQPGEDDSGDNTRRAESSDSLFPYSSNPEEPTSLHDTAPAPVGETSTLHPGSPSSRVPPWSPSWNPAVFPRQPRRGHGALGEVQQQRKPEASGNFNDEAMSRLGFPSLEALGFANSSEIQSHLSSIFQNNPIPQ